MSLSIKDIARSHWPRVLSRSATFMSFCDGDFAGEVGLIRLDRVKAPLDKTYGGKTVRILDDGYCWLQLAAPGVSYWLTAMYDNMGDFIQFYFDVSDDNVILPDGKAYFYDLLLDVVMTADGEIHLLDEDELCAALADGSITKAQYDKAREAARKIVAMLGESKEALLALCQRYFELLKLRLPGEPMHIAELKRENESHASQVAVLLARAFPHSYANCAGKEVERCLEEGKIALVALDGDAVIGFVGAMPQYGVTGWELHPLVVDEARRAQGIGRALCAELERRLREKGCVTVYLGTDDEFGKTSLSNTDLFEDTYGKIERIRNLKGHPYEFYQKVGYKIVGVIPDANGLGKPDIYMAKSLARGD